MSRAAGTSVENNFVHGLVTEATGMNFPESAATETYDCIFHSVGAVTRRLGFEPETNAVFQSVTSDNNSVTEYVWNNVSNRGDLSIVVQQIGMTLYYFEVAGDTLSANLIPDTTSLSTFLIAGAPTTSDGSVCTFSTGQGRLFVTHPNTSPFYVDYDRDAQTMTETAIDLEIRDFTRLDDNLDPDERPTTLTDAHQYNLYNQGWYITATAKSGGNQNVMTYFFNAEGKYPSNADIWWLFKNADEQIDSANFNKVYTGNSLAPGGHYIINPFDTDRQAQSGIGNLDEETAGTARPSINAFYAGRVWYGGTAAVGYGDKLYFSQIIENINQVGKCYSINDPTSEQNSDLLPSDGGVVVIPGVGTVYSLRTIGNYLVVIASNGVWTVSGSSGAGFFANDYAVQKISQHAGVGNMSVVEAEGTLLWWNYEGIYLFTSDQAGNIQVQSATDQTIKTFYQDVPTTNIPFVKGAYNPAEMVIQWIFRSTEASTTAQNFQYDRVLNLRINTQAFYPWTITTPLDFATAPYVSGIVCLRGSGSARIDDTVVDSSGNTVIEA